MKSSDRKRREGQSLSAGADCQPAAGACVSAAPVNGKLRPSQCTSAGTAEGKTQKSTRVMTDCDRNAYISCISVHNLILVFNGLYFLLTFEIIIVIIIVTFSLL